jgi:hypothetical protein
MYGLAAFIWLAMHIQGAGDCPAAADVEAKLGPLLPSGFVSESTDLVVIAEEGDGTLLVSLSRADGRPIAGRRLPRAASCAEQAETAAVALAVWEAQIHPEISLRLDHLAAPPAPISPPGRNDDLAVQSPIDARPAPGRTWALGAAALGSWQPGSVAPGGRLDAESGLVDRPWRWRLSVVGVAEHRLSLPPGQADWWRLYLTLGADYARPLSRRWSVALGAAGVVGIATAEGAGYSTDRTARSVDVGVEAILRVELQLGVIRPWIGLALVTWLRQQDLAVTGAAGSLALPRAEPSLVVGADFYGQP